MGSGREKLVFIVVSLSYAKCPVFSELKFQDWCRNPAPVFHAAIPVSQTSADVREKKSCRNEVQVLKPILMQGTEKKKKHF
jgi:hypothetical protein